MNNPLSVPGTVMLVVAKSCGIFLMHFATCLRSALSCHSRHGAANALRSSFFSCRAGLPGLSFPGLPHVIFASRVLLAKRASVHIPLLCSRLLIFNRAGSNFFRARIIGISILGAPATFCVSARLIIRHSRKSLAFRRPGGCHLGMWPVFSGSVRRFCTRYSR
jgi:hypothetical protein